MSVPEFQDFILPALIALKDGKIKNKHEISDLVADFMNISMEDRQELVPSGVKPRYYDRTSWALYYLYRANLIDRPQHAKYLINDLGRKILSNPPKKIDKKYLMQFPEFVKFAMGNKESNANHAEKVEDKINIISNVTPEDEIYSIYKEINNKLSDDLLDLVKSVAPSFFEQLVIDLLLKMGYGGSKAEAAKAVGKSGDGGIDGIINEDRLGLDKIYVQAKRWEGTVGRPIVQAFVGSLAGLHAKKGIFITTSDFTKDARDYIQKVEHQVSLIDGDKLVSLMIEHNLGINVAYTYDIKKIDRDYFPEDLD